MGSDQRDLVLLRLAAICRATCALAGRVCRQKRRGPRQGCGAQRLCVIFQMLAGGASAFSQLARAQQAKIGGFEEPASVRSFRWRRHQRTRRPSRCSLKIRPRRFHLEPMNKPQSAPLREAIVGVPGRYWEDSPTAASSATSAPDIASSTTASVDCASCARRRRRNPAHHLRPLIGLLHRSDREKAA